MDWATQGDVLPPAPDGGPDRLRAWEPSVLEEDDGTLRMWYSAHDGTTSRILEALQTPGRPWRRVGTAVDTGLAGDSDRYGVEAPCVVKFESGYLMAYGGFDGEENCLHVATSPDGHRWAPGGPIVAGETGPLAGRTPTLFVGADQWWLFYSAPAPHRADGSEVTNGSGGRRRTAILAAVSKPDGGWHPVGPVLEPERGEVATSHPCVVEISRTLYMFYASENEEHSSVALATSLEGVEWERRGVVVSTTDDPDSCAVTAPCVVRLRDGSLRMWYSRRPWGDDQLAYTIGSAVFSGTWPGSR